MIKEVNEKDIDIVFQIQQAAYKPLYDKYHDDDTSPYMERKEVTCKDLEKTFNFSGSTAYHHITILTKIGAVKIRNEGKTIFYSLNRKYFDMMRAQLKVFSND